MSQRDGLAELQEALDQAQGTGDLPRPAKSLGVCIRHTSHPPGAFPELGEMSLIFRKGWRVGGRAKEGALPEI